MNTTTNLERRVLLTAWLMQRAALLLLLLAPARAAATYVDHTSNYMVTPAGAGEIKFKMPVYDKDGDDCWVYEARLYYQVEGSDTKTEVFYLFIGDDDKWGDIPDSRPTLECDITNMGGGTLTIDPVVNGKNDRDPHSITIGTETVHCCVYNQGDQFYLNGVWIVPLEMRGKTVTFTWDVTRDGNHRDKHKVGGLMATTITIPEAMPAMTPMVMNPVISDSTGFMAVPWAIGVQAESVKDAYAIYYDTKDGPDRVMNDDDLTESHTVNLGFNSSGMFYIDATRPHYGVKVVVSYVDADGYMRTNNQSEPKYIPFVHSPHGFSATPANDGKGSVNLKWKIDYPDEEDFIETGDMWLIQRSITGRDEDFVDLTSIMFDRKSESYEYKDSTVLEALTADDINGTNLPIVLNSSLWA